MGHSSCRRPSKCEAPRILCLVPRASLSLLEAASWKREASGGGFSHRAEPLGRSDSRKGGGGPVYKGRRRQSTDVVGEWAGKR